MQNDWLAATHFERMHEAISAINTLSIHAKLALAGVQDPTPPEQAEQARERLAERLSNLDQVVEQFGFDERGTITGTDPWLRSLAVEFVDGRMRREGQSLASARMLDLLESLVRSDRAEDLERLVPYLQELRKSIEATSQPDVASVLGNDSW